jgi:hypothetical protein
VGAGSGVSVRGVYDRAHSLVPISRFLVSFMSARDHSLFNVVVIADRAEEEEAYDGSYRTVPSLPSLLSTLAIEDAVAAAVATAFVLLGARGEDTAPRAPRPSSPLSYHTVPSLLSALAIEDAATAAAATTVVLLRGRGRGVAHMMHASPRSFSFTMVQAPHSHDDGMMLE